MTIAAGKKLFERRKDRPAITAESVGRSKIAAGRAAFWASHDRATGRATSARAVIAEAAELARAGAGGAA